MFRPFKPHPVLYIQGAGGPVEKQKLQCYSLKTTSLGLNRRMEGRTMRAAVLAACLLVLLLSGQPAPVSGSIISKYKDKYYKCFRKCYTSCRDNDHQPAASAAALAGGSDGACREICLASVGCSTDAAAATGGGRGPTDADVAACVDGCKSYYGRMNAKHV